MYNNFISPSNTEKNINFETNTYNNLPEKIEEKPMGFEKKNTVLNKKTKEFRGKTSEISKRKYLSFEKNIGPASSRNNEKSKILLENKEVTNEKIEIYKNNKTEKSYKAETSNNFFINKNKDNTNNINKPTKQYTINRNSSLKTTPTIYEAPGKDSILFEKYNLIENIGKGSYATVQLVAIKSYEKINLCSAQKQKNVQREIVLLTKINHPNVIKLYESIDNYRSIHLIMEYVGNTSLLSFIRTHPEKRIPEPIAKRIFFQLAQTLTFLHTKCVIHRDIKLENIIVYDNLKIKLIDFGFSICIQKSKKLAIFCGTPTYMAPEIVSKKAYLGTPVDIWSSGILLYAMLCGKFPFKNSDEKVLFRRILSGVFNFPDYLSENAKKLIKKILVVNPEERITAEQVKIIIIKRY